jgi:phosphatidylglycerophosphate synthase
LLNKKTKGGIKLIKSRLGQKIIADLLTTSRAVLSLIIMILIINNLMIYAAILFTIAILTDIIDGTFARKFPYSEKESITLWWRKYNIDPISDTALIFLPLIGMAVIGVQIINIPIWWLIIVLALALVILNFLSNIVINKKTLRVIGRLWKISGACSMVLIAGLLLILAILEHS